MDPVSVVNSVIAFIQIADRVIRACKQCIDAVKDAPKEMQMILGETISLRAIIESLNSVNLHTNTIQLVPSLFAPLGPVEACRRCLSQLEGLVPQEQPQRALQGKRKITLVELAWPLKESKARRLMAEISQHKATLLLAMTGDMMHDIKEIRSGVQRVEDTLTDTQRQDIIRWIERTNPSALHNAAFRKHETHTCTWILQTPEWKSWINTAQSMRLLWIHGIPGSGKTVLASFIIEEIQKSYAGNDEVGHAYYYCHFSHNQDEAMPFLRWAIAKLCRQRKWIPQQLKTLHDDGCDPTIPQLEDVLEAICARFSSVYLIIDAMDESNPRGDFLTVIATLANDKRFSNVRILATSRLYLDIERTLASCSMPLSMSNSLVERDIREFVRTKLASSHLMRRWSNIWDDIEDSLVAGARGM
ncbi:vegetative incompatibility protein het-e-1 [Dactylonectria macrodidyma]|uniref:Vegetative incompatibility protein het-e-1 n=1 Tax=Dactylonectria macrodidyma TaxID=307937 RepID=A0A9P9FMK4_9HYPO|nr:vegetative incompatibility protein het-e-1 [Dactylonectria macrodidyma]